MTGRFKIEEVYLDDITANGSVSGTYECDERGDLESFEIEDSLFYFEDGSESRLDESASPDLRELVERTLKDCGELTLGDAVLSSMKFTDA